MGNRPHIIMPVKDSILTVERAIRAIVQSGHVLTVYNDYSSEQTKAQLTLLSKQLHFNVIHIEDYIQHPSPNYLWVLCHAREEAIRDNAPLIIIESDVIIQTDTIAKLQQSAAEGVGLVAAVTMDDNGLVNFPYEYARHWKKQTIQTRKRLSFCCTLLTTDLLNAIDFETELDPQKNWYDVTISHRSVELGFANILQMDNPVLHLPHSSRPWKLLKYSNPILYYWRKLTQHKDRI